jgi:hypothetical protein
VVAEDLVSQRWFSKRVVVKPKHAKVLAVFPLVVSLGICILVCRRYYARPVLKLANGATTRDYSVAQIGVFAGPQFSAARAAYLRNRSLYQQLVRERLPADPTEVEHGVAMRLVARLASAKFAKAAFERQPPEVIDKLKDHWSLVLARCAGLPMHQYLSSLPPGLSTAIPSNTGALDKAMRDFLQTRLDSDNHDPGYAQGLFEKLYAASTQAGPNPSEISEVAIEDGGSILAMDYGKPTDTGDLISARLHGHQESYFIGNLSQGQLLFHQYPPEATDPADRVLEAQFIAIVFTASGDCYPMAICSRYNSKQHQWWLLKVAREASPQMAVSAPLAF